MTNDVEVEKAVQVVVQSGEKINDLPSNLPSVKELAFKFLPKKSPEPMPRKSIKVINISFLSNSLIHEGVCVCFFSLV